MIAMHTPAEAAAILAVKPSWLLGRAYRRAVPFHKLGGAVRFSDQDLEQIAAMHVETPRLPTPPAARVAGRPASYPVGRPARGRAS